MDKLFRTDKLLTGPTQVITPNSLSNLALKQCTSSFNRNIIIRTPTVIDKMETPLNKKNVKIFLGKASYYRSYVVDFLNVIKPLTNLIKEEVPFHWTKQCESAFQSIKDSMLLQQIIISHQVSHPNVTRSSLML